MKKLITIALLLTLFSSCHRYERKILKVDITCDKDCLWTWGDLTSAGGCEEAGNRSVYYKEGTQLKVRVVTCGNVAAHLEIKVKEHILYQATSKVQTVNVAVERK